MLIDNKWLIRAGASLIPLHSRSKKPIDHGWTSKETFTYEELKKRYKKGQNLGIRLGQPSKLKGGFLHVFDCDVRVSSKVDEAFDQLEELFPNVSVWDLPRVRSGSGGDSIHIYFVTDIPFPSKKLAHSEAKFTDKKGTRHWEWEIELFGTGKQVAVPPSIHPDTDLEYTWEVEFHQDCLIESDDLEELFDGSGEGSDRSPDELEPLGLDSDEIAESLNLVQEWANDHTSWRNVGMALKHELGRDGWEIFDEWSRKGEGYNRSENWTQWRAFKNDHRNPITMRTIQKAARDRLYEEEYDAIADEFEDLDDEVEEDDEPAKSVNKGLEDVPTHLLKIPGKLQLAIDYYNETAMKPQPQFAVQAALALGSVVLARFYRTDQDNFTSLYFLNIAETSSGKEHSKRVIERILEAANRPEFIGPKAFTSEAGVLSSLMMQPKQISISDEFGRYLGSSRRSGNTLKEEAQSAFMELFGRLDGTYRGSGYSTHGMSKDQIEELKNRSVEKPGLTVLGMTTPQTFYESLSGMDVKDGYLNRFLIVASPLGRQRSREDLRPTTVPKELIRWIEQFSYDSDGDGCDELTLMTTPKASFEPILVPFSKECRSILRDMEDEILDHQSNLDAFGMSELLGRSREIAMRVALIIALSEESTSVRRKHLMWAKEYVFHYHLEMIEAFKENLGKTADEQIADAVFKIIKKGGKRGATFRDLVMNCRPFRTLNTRGREEVVNRLKTDFGVKIAELRSSGRKRVAFVAP